MCLRGCLEAHNLASMELLEDEDLNNVRKEEWFNKLVEEVKRYEEEHKDRKGKRRRDEGIISSDDDEEDEEGEGMNLGWNGPH